MGTETPPTDPDVSSPNPSPDAEETDAASETRSIGGQRNLFSTKDILIAFPALSVALFVSFLDQTSVSTAIPAISDDLNTGSATSWIGASFLIAATAFQLINGRLSDIFGRKNLLLICLGLLAGGDLVCGFARSKEQLFAFRAIAGIGGGGVNSVAMIIVSDITTLQNRGKFQGILGAIIAAANGCGPFIGGVIVEKASWPWVFWLVPIVAVPAGLAIFFFLPLKHNSGNHLEKFKMIDYGGIFLNIAGCLLILIPLSGGGVSYAWASAMVISMMVIGGLIWIAFGLWEWKIARVPIMPLRLYNAPHCPCLYGQSFLQGTAFYGNFFYLPIYFQSALGYSAIKSGAAILPLIITSSVASIAAGFLMARSGRYMPCVVAGYCIWSLASGLKCMLNQDTPLGHIIAFLVVEGVGIGFTLQPISGAILSNTLSSGLANEDFQRPGLVEQLSSSTYSLDDLSLGSAEKARVLEVYMTGLHYIFIFYAAVTGLAALLSLGVGNTDLRKEPADADKGSSSTDALSRMEASEIVENSGEDEARPGVLTGKPKRETNDTPSETK